jgi:hypothetical protein
MVENNSKIVYQEELVLWAGMTGSFDIVVQIEGRQEPTRLHEELEVRIVGESQKVKWEDVLVEPTRLGKYRITVEKLED